MFKTFETVEGTDCTTDTHGIEALLEQEDNGNWRLFQERGYAARPFQGDHFTLQPVAPSPVVRTISGWGR